MKLKSKRNLTKSKILRNFNELYPSLIIPLCIILIFAIILLFLIVFSSQNPSNSKTLVKSSNLILTTSEPPTSSIPIPSNEIKLKELSEARSFPHIRDVFDVFQFLLSKLHPDHNDLFFSAIIEYATNVSNFAYKKYMEIQQSVDLIEDYSRRNIDVYNPANDIETTNYNLVLFELFKLLYKSHKQFNTSDFWRLYDPETKVNLNAIDIRFVYQQLHLRTILTTIIHVIEMYQPYIKKKLKEYLNLELFEYLAMSLFVQFGISKAKLFKPYNDVTGFEYKGRRVVIENLMASYKEYERFLVTNMYFVLMHVFEIKNNSKYLSMNEYFGRFFLDLHGIYKKNDLIERKKIIMHVCNEVFQLLYIMGNEISFENLKSETFERCSMCIMEGWC